MDTQTDIDRLLQSIYYFFYSTKVMIFSSQFLTHLFLDLQKPELLPYLYQDVHAQHKITKLPRRKCSLTKQTHTLALLLMLYFEVYANNLGGWAAGSSGNPLSSGRARLTAQ